MRRILPGWVQWPQLDVPLLAALLLLMGFGLLVLYSASGQDMAVVYRQGTRMGVFNFSIEPKITIATIWAKGKS